MKIAYKALFAALGIVGIALLSLLANTMYGYGWKDHVIRQELRFALPRGGVYAEYHYFWGKFEAVVEFNSEEAFDAIVDNLFGPYGLYIVHDVDPGTVNTGKNVPLEGNPIVQCTEFYLGIPPTHVGGVIWKLKGKTFLYIISPPEKYTFVAE